MADTGWISCASYAQRASTGDIAWSPTSGTTELASSDNTRIATASGLTNNSASDSTNQMLCAFSTAIADNVPADATIDGVEVTVEGYFSSQNNSVRAALHSDSSGTLVTNTAAQSVNTFGNGSASQENVNTFGGASNLWGAGSIAASSIRAAALRLAVYVSSFASVGPSILYLDHVRIKVYYTYTPPPDPQDSIALFWSAP